MCGVHVWRGVCVCYVRVYVWYVYVWYMCMWYVWYAYEWGGATCMQVHSKGRRGYLVL